VLLFGRQRINSMEHDPVWCDHFTKNWMEWACGTYGGEMHVEGLRIGASEGLL
jgi:hypothetical protein